MTGNPYYWTYGYQHHAYPRNENGIQSDQWIELQKMLHNLSKQLEEIETRLNLMEEKLNQIKNIDFSALLK